MKSACIRYEDINDAMVCKKEKTHIMMANAVYKRANGKEVAACPHFLSDNEVCGDGRRFWRVHQVEESREALIRTFSLPVPIRARF